MKESIKVINHFNIHKENVKEGRSESNLGIWKQ